MLTISVEPKEEGKGRTFSAPCLGYVDAPKQLDYRQSDVSRPVVLVVGGAETEVRPLVANLLLGRKAIIHGREEASKGRQVECQKSLKYRVAWQRWPAVPGPAPGVPGTPASAVAWVYLPGPCLPDPGMVDPTHVRFTLAPPVTSLAMVDRAESLAAGQYVKKLSASRIRERWDTDPLKDVSPEEIGADLPLAKLFCVYLDRRTRRPLVDDPRFQLRLLHAALKNRHAAWYPNKWFERVYDALRAPCMDKLGIPTILAFSATHEEVDELLTTEVRTYMESTARNAVALAG